MSLGMSGEEAYVLLRGCSHKHECVIIKEWNYEKSNMSK